MNAGNRISRRFKSEPTSFRSARAPSEASSSGDSTSSSFSSQASFQSDHENDTSAATTPPSSAIATPAEPSGAHVGKEKPADPRMAPSGTALAALDLAVSKNALSVPALVLPRFNGVTNINELFRKANFISHDLIKDEFGAQYQLSHPFANGSFGAVRLINKLDPVVNQTYVAKEIRLKEQEGRGNSFDYSNNKPSFLKKNVSIEPVKVNLTEDELLHNEIEAMLAAKSAVTPHAILRTRTNAYVLLPQLDGDAFDLIAQIHAMGNKQESFDLRSAKQVALNVKPSSMALWQARLKAGYSILYSPLDNLISLHEAGMAHRDIKPDNYLYDRSGELHLIDYGLATRESDKGFRGTLEYLPFEALITRPGIAKTFSPMKGDIWALGASAMAALVGNNITWELLRDDQDNEIDIRDPKQQKNLERSYRNYSDVWRTTSMLPDDETKYRYLKYNAQAPAVGRMLASVMEMAPQIFNLVFAALAPNPSKRPTAAQFKQMCDEWVDPVTADLSIIINSHDMAMAGRKPFGERDASAKLRSLIHQVARNGLGAETSNIKATHLSMLEVLGRAPLRDNNGYVKPEKEVPKVELK